MIERGELVQLCLALSNRVGELIIKYPHDTLGVSSCIVVVKDASTSLVRLDAGLDIGKLQTVQVR